MHQIEEMVVLEKQIENYTIETIPTELLLEAKMKGYADRQIAYLVKCLESAVYKKRNEENIKRVYKLVDTCAAEFTAKTPYYYSTFEMPKEVNGEQFAENESEASDKKKIIVLGSGPNRIGQGIEFDYSCVHGVLATKECGYETIMINCNPETVSTDFDTADKLYFEPVFWEHIYDIICHEKPEGVIVQLGGQTALKLAEKLERYGIKIMGTSYNALDVAEDRGKFSELLKEHNIPYPEFEVAETAEDAIEISKHYSDYYSPNNAILVIVGDFQTENVLSLINQFFGPISRKLLPSLTPVFEPEQEGEKRLRITRPGRVSYIQLAYHSPDILNDDFYVLLVIDALLCGAKGSNVWSGPWNDSALRTSRLYQSLIDTQLVTHVNSSLVPTRDPYLYKLSLTLPDSSHLRLSEDTVDFELENIKDTQVSDDDLYRAKNQLWTRFYLDQSSVYKIAHQLGYFESIASFTILENFAEKIQRVSKLDVQRVARKVFKKKSRTVGWFVPEFSKNNVEVEDLSAQSGKFDLKKF